MNKSFKKGFIGIPKKLSKNNEEVYCRYNDIDISSMVIKTKKLPVVFYLNGSAGFTKGEVYRRWIIENTEYIFFSPDTLSIKSRPFYKDRALIEEYELVHSVRQNEISYNIKQLLKESWVDKDKIILMGNSEGGLAASRYSGDEFSARILLAWSCEQGYYTNKKTIGFAKHIPVLTIIGVKDEYFSKSSKYSTPNTIGNCSTVLSSYNSVKSIILSNTGHNLLKNSYTKNEIISFLKFLNVTNE